MYMHVYREEVEAWCLFAPPSLDEKLFGSCWKKPEDEPTLDRYTVYMYMFIYWMCIGIVYIPLPFLSLCVVIYVHIVSNYPTFRGIILIFGSKPLAILLFFFRKFVHCLPLNMVILAILVKF